MKSRTRKMLYSVALSTIVIFILSLFFSTADIKNTPDNFVSNQKVSEEKAVVPFNVSDLEARAVYVFDILKNKPLYILNEREQLPLASLTKIMTITLADEFISRESFEVLRDKFNDALVASSNEAAVFLAAEAASSSKRDFVEAMNERARELNLNQTYFLNETGLDISNEISGAYGSAEDVSRLLVYAVKKNPEMFEPTTYKKFGKLENTNISAGDSAPLVASKTGFTDLAGGNLAVVFDAGFGHPVVVVVLGSSRDGRFTDMDKIIKATLEYLK